MKGLKIQRIKTDLTQEQLALATGISVRCIRSYEQGKRKPKPETVTLLANYFNCSPQDLF